MLLTHCAHDDGGLWMGAHFLQNDEKVRQMASRTNAAIVLVQATALVFVHDRFHLQVAQLELAISRRTSLNHRLDPEHGAGHSW